MKNTVTLVGFVGNNPEVRTAQSGASITSISLATSRSFKDGEGNRQTETEWHRITCFNGVGKSVAEHVTKGAMVIVTGRIHYTRWTDSEGQTRYGCEITAEQIDFLAKAKVATKNHGSRRLIVHQSIAEEWTRERNFAGSFLCRKRRRECDRFVPRGRADADGYLVPNREQTANKVL